MIKSLRSFKNTSILLLFAGISACSGPETKSEIPSEGPVSAVDSIQNKMLNTLEEIYSNLELIRQKQGSISGDNTEVPDKKEQILKDISLINTLLEENRQKIAWLEKQSAEKGHLLASLNRLAKQTKQTMQKQEEEILDLKQQLALEEFKVMDLNVKMDEMQAEGEKVESERNELLEANASLEKDLNKVFVTYGTYEQLHEKKIVSGRSGLTSKKGILSDGFSKNRAWFSEQDKREIAQVPVKGVKPRVLTLHPEDSYEWKTDGGYSQLIIKDKESFWSVSRFLVIQVQ